MGIFRRLFGRGEVAVATRRVVQPQPVSESVYLPSSRWDELLVARPDGLPPLHLTRHDGALWLAEDSTGLLVNGRNRKLAGMGVWGVNVRGGSYHQPALRRADLWPGKRVCLVREPDNEFDKNAIAIHDDPDTGVLGYVNKQMASRLAKRLDAGETLTTLCISMQPFKIVLGHEHVISWLARKVK